MTYNPNPIDTSNIQLPNEILEIAEVLAKNTHEVWAKGKTDEGYSFGPVTSAENKTHKNLVPYEDLSAADKAYDIRTSLETVKVLLKLGFTIEAPQQETRL